MSNARPDVKAIFCEAITKDSPTELAAYLDQACRHNDVLRKRVETLLRADQRAGRFLGGVELCETALLDSRQIGETPGADVGPYRLVEKLGEGAFGVVYKAEQRDALRRTVAVKIIKPGMDSKEVVARFEAERQALAMMSHPSIARVFGAGATPSGRPYFAMELVKGLPITEHCDQKNLTTDERLALFVTVCQAVQHAHQKGIIHRDLKPSNILVTEIDGTPIAKVIDFGIAKALHQPLTDHTLVTGSGQTLGTPLYMSPEQADPKFGDVDTRSDIYSLGVVLYELLTGTTPVDRTRLQNAKREDLPRIICEEEPLRPSTRISTLGDTATEVCKHRQSEPKRLSALMRGDLDWIVMKCLEKDRSRRYDTASGLAKDVQRHLNHQPVEATPASALYTLRKFAHRNQSLLQKSAATACLLCLVFAGGWKWRSASAESRLAEAKTKAHEDVQEAENRLRQKDVLGAFQLLVQAAPMLPELPKVNELMAQTSCTWTSEISPSGSTVRTRPCGASSGTWQAVRTFPCRLPRIEHFWEVAKDGCVTARGCAGPGDVHLKIQLAQKGHVPLNMVRIQTSTDTGEDFEVIIDANEVTNDEFKSFVEQGGYRDEKFWKHLAPYKLNGKEVPFNELVRGFRDKSGEFGPSTWNNGSYPNDQGRFPVGGVSWYEAAAYAKFVDKRLPTVRVWELAACFGQREQLIRRSNFGGKGPISVGGMRGMNSFGVCDMAGNVKEWCWNETFDGLRGLRGGAWNEHTYMFTALETYPPTSRYENIGFRCVKNFESLRGDDEGRIVSNATVPPPLVPPPTLEDLELVKKLFVVEKDTPLNEKPITNEESRLWRREVIEIDAAYGKERFVIHLVMPKASAEEGQTFLPIVYFPGTGAKRSTEFSTAHADFAVVGALAQTGRAVCYPVYQGTFERSAADVSADTAQRQRELAIQQTQDVIRAVDYLATRPDMAMDKLTYLGWSWGGGMATRMVVVEDRFRACIIMGGGLATGNLRALDGRIYAPYVTMPVLMLGGKLDTVVSFPARQIPLFKALAACPDKTLEPFESGHVLPWPEAVAKIDQWLDKRFPQSASGPEDKGEWLQQMAELFMKQKRYREAEVKYTEVVAQLADKIGLTHRDTLEARRSLANSVHSQGRIDEGARMLEECLAKQTELFGSADEHTRATAENLVGLYSSASWQRAKNPNAKPDEYEYAAKLAKRGIEICSQVTLREPVPIRTMTALAFYRLERWDECFAAASGAPVEDYWNVGTWLVMAMCQHKLGRVQSAKDWYTAAAESNARSANPSNPLLAEAAALLGMPLDWPPDDWTSTRGVEVYSRLIAEQPKLGKLYHVRASYYGRLGDWKNALSDYTTASEVDPVDYSHWEAKAAVCAALGDGATYDAVCQSQFTRLKNSEKHNMRITWVLMSSLGASKPVDPIELDRVALDVIEDPTSPQTQRPYYGLARGMALYRCERWEAALQAIPTSNFVNPKDEILAIVFRAMAHARLGDGYTSRKLLEQARGQARSQLLPLDGPELRYQNRAVVAAMVHAALREADSLILSHSAPTQPEQRDTPVASAR